MTEAAKQQTAADRLKHRLNTGTLGGDQDSRDVEQVIADYERVVKANGTFGAQAVIDGQRIVDLEAALAQKTRECEELKQRIADEELAFNHANEVIGKYEAQVEQLERQVAELSKPVTDVTDEEAKASFTVWNGWIAYALEWEELDDAQQKRWKAALIAARAALR